MRIENLAQMKRAISTPGISIRVVSHWQGQLVGTTRTPTKIQTNGYYFEGPNLSGVVVRMWSGTPKASELRFNPDGSVTFYPGTSHEYTLSFESGAQAHEESPNWHS